ncbi:MAG: hemin uptake protein HemP [Pirellulales bacterium]
MDQIPSSQPHKSCDAHPKGAVLNPVPFTELTSPGVNEIWISFNGKLYRLQATKQGKLILTK